MTNLTMTDRLGLGEMKKRKSRTPVAGHVPDAGRLGTQYESQTVEQVLHRQLASAAKLEQLGEDDLKGANAT